jgi:lipopolysaccharide export LptBFGC system permease protein LptF
MLRFQRAIAREVVLGLVAATVVVTVVLFAGRGVHLLNRMPGLEIRYLLPLLPTLLPAALALALPYALAVSTALAYGRIVADRESSALRLSGVPLQAVVAPAAMVGALLSLVALWLHAGPAAGAEQQLRTRQRDLADRFLALLSGPDRAIALEGARISFGRYAGGEFHDVEIDRREKDTGVLLQKIIGDRVSLRRVGGELEIRSPLLWVVGESGVERRGGGEGEEDPAAPAPARPRGGDGEKDADGGLVRIPVGALRSAGAVAAGSPSEGSVLNVGHVESIGALAALSELLDARRFERKPKDMELDDLAYLSVRGEIPKISARRTRVEYHGRLAAGATPFVFALIAAAGALQVPVGGRRLLAILCALAPVFALHFPLSLFGRSLAESGALPVPAGLWAANGATLLAALLLLRRAALR